MDFIQEYWKELVVIGLSALTLLVSMFRKKIRVQISDELYSQVLERLPGWIASAESTGSSGTKKLSLVLGYAYSFLEEKVGINRTYFISFISDRLSKAVEDILSTPEKKGISYESEIK